MRERKLKVKEHDKLRVYWGREADDRYADKSLVVSWPMMVQGSCDASWLFSEVFTDEVKEEFIRRGWDITTLRFSIAPKLVDPKRPERFQTLLSKYADDIKELEKENDR
jgi:hypothetical protein